MILTEEEKELTRILEVFLKVQGFSLKIVTMSKGTCTVEIEPSRCVLIKTPGELNKEKIKYFLLNTKSLIEKKLLNDFNILDARHLVDGDMLPYLGKFFELRFFENQDVPFKFENGFFVHSTFRDVLKIYLRNFYFLQPRGYFVSVLTFMLQATDLCTTSFM